MNYAGKNHCWTHRFSASSRSHRLERLDHLAKKFQHKCEIHEEWSEGKIDLLKSADFKKCSLNDLRALSRKHLAFESDLSAHQDRVEQIAAIAQELNVLGYEQIAAVNQRCQKICNEWDELGELTHKRRVALNEAERIVERIDSLFLEYAKKAAPYLNWLDGAREDLVDMFFIHTLDEICGKERDRSKAQIDATFALGLIAAHNQFKATLGEADAEYKNIIRLVNDARQTCQDNGLELTPNPYTNIQPDVSFNNFRLTMLYSVVLECWHGWSPKATPIALSVVERNCSLV